MYHDDKEGEQPKLSFNISLFLLAVVTVFTIFSVKYLIGSIEEIVESFGISETSIGFVLPVATEVINYLKFFRIS